MKNSLSSFNRYFLFPICGLLFILLGPIVAQGATYYVSLTGSDSNPGTLSKPFRTFSKAVSPLRPGDTLYIRGGLWTTQLDLQKNNISGTSSGWIKIAGYPGETVTIRYAEPITNGYGPIKARGTRGYLIFENLTLDGINMPNKSGWQFPKENHHFTLRNLVIKNFKFNGLYIEANNVQVVNCTIHNQISASGSTGERWYGIYYHHGANGLIQGNKIYSNPGGGLIAYPGPISNLIIRNNAIYNNNRLSSSPMGGIHVQGSSSTPISSTQIFNNLVYRNGTSTSGHANGIKIADYTNGTKVWNNTVYGNKTYGLFIGVNATTSKTVVQNNVSYGNSYGNYYNGGSSTTYTNNLTTDPKFVSPSSNNFQLQSTSPAINKGAILSGVPNDYRNYSRPRGSSYDIGGYEY